MRGASVRWLCMEREDHDVTPSWALDSLVPAPRAAVEVMTDDEGRYEFLAPPCSETEFGTVVVASASGYVPKGWLVDAETRKKGDLELVLTRGRPVVVRVVDARGNPVPGAKVTHYDCDSRSQGRLRPLEERALWEAALTDSDGRVSMAAFGGEQIFVATFEQQSSLPWKGSHPVEIELALAATFSVAGSVDYPDRDQWEPEYEGERRVEIACRESGTWRALAVARNLEDEFLLPSVPVSEAATLYRIRLEGAPVVTEDRFFPPPRSGDQLAFDFSATKGAAAYLYLDDPEGTPITTATARLTWEVDGVASREAFGASRPDGYLYIGTFLPGTVRIQVEAPGFAPHVGLYSLPIEDALWLRLERSHSVRGVCRHAGQPVEDFELIYWRSEASEVRARRPVRHATNGEFTLDLGPGTWSIQAASSLHPACKPAVVEVPSGAAKSLELDLQTPLLGGGVVVDASSGEAVGAALVQAFTGDGKDRTLRWGEPARTSADGSFELQAFVRGSNTITVNADGYAEALVVKSSALDGLVDWGEIRLVRPQDLRLSLHGHEETPTGAAAWWAHTLQGFALPKTHFGTDGRLTFTGVPPGDHRVMIQDRAGAWVRLHLALKSGADWNYSVAIGGPKRVAVRVLEEDGTLHTDPLMVFVGGTEDGHYVLRESERPEEGVYHFGGVATDALDVSATNAQGQDVASKQVSLAGRDSLEVDLVIESSPLRLRVVDTEGEPVPAVRVRVRALDENRVLVVNNTSSDGWVSLPGVPREACLVDAMHDSGMRLAVPIDANLREQELVLEPSASLTLVLKDGDEALAGVTTRVQTPDGTSLAAPLDTDADGTARRDGLGEGAYYVACSRADCWPTSVRRTLVTGEQATQEVPMRRLASAELLVLGPEGLPVTGVSATFTSLEFKHDVSDWLAQGLVTSPTGLTSNQSGRILVEGLPNGPYGWSIALESGTSAGSFTLAPGENTRTLQLR